MKIKGKGQNPIEQLLPQVQEKEEGEKTPAKSLEVDRDDATRVELSHMSRLKRLVEQLPEVDSNRVEQLKKQVQAGTYSYDSRRAAEKILEESLFLQDIL